MIENTHYVLYYNYYKHSLVQALKILLVLSPSKENTDNDINWRPNTFFANDRSKIKEFQVNTDECENNSISIGRKHQKEYLYTTKVFNAQQFRKHKNNHFFCLSIFVNNLIFFLMLFQCSIFESETTIKPYRNQVNYETGVR